MICVVLQSACNTEVDKSNNSRYLITGTGYYYIHGALHMFIGSDAQGGVRCLRLVRGRDFNVGRVGILVVDY